MNIVLELLKQLEYNVDEIPEKLIENNILVRNCCDNVHEIKITYSENVETLEIWIYQYASIIKFLYKYVITDGDGFTTITDMIDIVTSKPELVMSKLIVKEVKPCQ